MKIPFQKYQGTGNDFVMIDNRNLVFPKENTSLIAEICHRRFGVGADGLILLENNEEENIDFAMVYFNSDGRESTMCGNGGRCLVAFAHSLGVFKEKTTFLAIDGLHEASIKNNLVYLKMKDVKTINTISDCDTFLDTGSPHFVKVVEAFPNDFVNEAKVIRHSKRFDKDGVNVNFIIPYEQGLHIRTFERGVEDETYSCGTGAVAAALCYPNLKENNLISITTLGGELQVSFENSNNQFSNIWLIGPAQKVFDGEFAIK